jgi:hypothetical protein
MLYHPKKIDYTSPASAQGGPGVQKQITHYFGTPYIDMTTATWAGVSAAIGARLGDIWWLGGDARANGGNAFMFVKATAGLTLGQLVATALPTATTAHNPGPGECTTSVVTTHYDTSLLAANCEVDNWVFVNATGAALPQLRRIKANTSAVLSAHTVALRDYLRPNSPLDADIFDTVATDNNPVCIIRPHNVIVNTATTTPVGVALGTVTSGSYTIIQVAGLACVLTTGTGTALSVNVPAVGAAAGVAAGSAAGAANLYTGASLILPQIANAAANIIIPCYVNFTGQ